MPVRLGPLLGCILVGLALAACRGTGPPGPAELPMHLEHVAEVGHAVTAGDLDGDGYDELVDYEVELDWQPEGMHALMLYDSRRELIEQVNFQGRLLPPEFVDADGDGMAELLVPFVRDDSLFVGAVGRLGTKRFSFFVAAGAPRREPEGEIPWDPDVRMRARDLDGDGRPELIVQVVTAYARHPRGLIVFAMPEGRPLGSHFTGAKTITGFGGDFDGDGRYEMAFTAWATRNGAVAGGLDDRHAYVLAYEFHPEPVLTWHRRLDGRWARPVLTLSDRDGDGRDELVLCNVSFDHVAQIEVLDPATGSALQQRRFDAPLEWCRVFDVDGDRRAETILLHDGDEVWLVDADLEIRRRAQLPVSVAQLTVTPDFDGDGHAEILAITRGEATTLVLGPDLSVRAVWPGRLLHRVRRGLGRRPYVLARAGGRSYLLAPTANPSYVFVRAAPWAAGVALLLVLAAVVTVGRRRLRTRRLREALHRRLFDDDGVARLVVGADGHVEEAGRAAENWLEGETPRRRLRAGPVRAFVTEGLRRGPTGRVEAEVASAGPGARPARVRVEPLPMDGTAPLWLVTIDAPHTLADRDHVSLLMAQRIAHDIKNPLTSILLTLQRLQMEYQDRAPVLGEALDPYTERIVARIEQLRRMTRNFMKIVDEQGPTLQMLDLSGWLADRCETVRAMLPPDIDLALRLEDAPPPVRADPDQLEEVLANLVANAVEAMPQGGTLTVATGVAYGLWWPGEQAACDFVLLEVLDTGVGLVEEDAERFFEVGYSRFENGTGLGLALVRRIVEDHGGRIEVEGEPGVGAAFTLYFPTAGAATPPTVVRAASPPSAER